MGLVTTLAVVFGTSALAAPSANANDAYGTNYQYSCGLSLWGYWCQLTLTKGASERMKDHMVAGETMYAVSVAGCSKIPSWITEGTCIAWLTYNGAVTRNAVNTAHASSGKCVALRWYNNAAANTAADHASAVTCNFGIQCCADGSGGGGGGGGGGSWKTPGGDGPGPHTGGGGGSWRQTFRSATMAAQPIHAFGRGGGGSSW